MRAAVKSIEKLWVNGKAVGPVVASLEVDPGRRSWRVRARLGRYSPFRQQFGLSMQLGDGRTAHGRAVLVEADGEDVVFEGEDVLEGRAAEELPPEGVDAEPEDVLGGGDAVVDVLEDGGGEGGGAGRAEGGGDP